MPLILCGHAALSEFRIRDLLSRATALADEQAVLNAVAGAKRSVPQLECSPGVSLGHVRLSYADACVLQARRRTQLQPPNATKP